MTAVAHHHRHEQRRQTETIIIINHRAGFHWWQSFTSHETKFTPNGTLTRKFTAKKSAYFAYDTSGFL